MIQMTKPEITQLKHQDLFADAITKEKDKSVLSWWWLTIPIYIIAMLLMKSIYMPHTTLISNFHEWAGKDKYSSILFLLILPIVFIIINLISVRRIYFLSGSLMTIRFVKSIWYNISIIIFFLFVLIIYSL